MRRELAAARPPAARETVAAGFTHRTAVAGIAAGQVGWQPHDAAPQPARPASGFAADGPLDALDAGIVLAGLAFDWLERGECQHPRHTNAGQPGPRLRDLLAVRNPTCRPRLSPPRCRLRQRAHTAVRSGRPDSRMQLWSDVVA